MPSAVAACPVSFTFRFRFGNAGEGPDGDCEVSSESFQRTCSDLSLKQQDCKDVVRCVCVSVCVSLYVGAGIVISIA